MPFWCFHDHDIAPEGATFAESAANLDHMVDLAAEHQQRTGVELLWGTAKLFANRRFMAGAATNPDPEVFAYAAGQVAHCMNVTHRLGGHNYVLWGGREGYETLLNTDMKRELDQLGRFLNLVVEHKHEIGFEGTILHRAQAVRADQAPVRLRRRRPCTRSSSATASSTRSRSTSRSTTPPWPVTTSPTRSPSAVNAGIFGSIDANAGDDRLGWDVDRFPVSVEQMTLGMLEILRGGGFTTGGLNFDSKLRRQSIARDDLFHRPHRRHGHDGPGAAGGGVDHRVRRARRVPRRALRRLGSSDFGRELLAGKHSLADLYERALTAAEPSPVCGRQEQLENLVARHIERVR